MISLNGHVITPTVFNDNTSQVWQLPAEVIESIKKDPIKILWEFESEGEFLHLAQLRMLIDTTLNRPKRVELVIPFLPYGRQDKEVSNESTFALRAFAKLLNSLNFKVTTLDAHSNVGHSIIDNFENIEPESQIQYAVDTLNPDAIVLPDIGARRYSSITCLLDRDFIELIKVRDPLTGFITGQEVLHGADYFSCTVRNSDKSALIVDDLCDGGYTFILAANRLKELGFAEIYLYTTHGIYSKGTKVLRDAGITRIFNKDGEVL